MQGIATLPYEVTEEPNYPTEGINTIKHAADMMADFGRHGDTYIVHAAEGETVLPMEVLEANPRMKRMIHQQMEEMGLDPQRYIVGTEFNSINPVTGQPEFFLKKIGRAFKKTLKSVGKIAKKLAPIVLPIAAPFMFPLMPVAFSAGIGSLVGGMAGGLKFKDALKGAALTAATAGVGSKIAGRGFGGSLSGGPPQGIGDALRSMTDPATYQFQNPVTTFSSMPATQPANQQQPGKIVGKPTNTTSSYFERGSIPQETPNFLQRQYDRFIAPDRPSMSPDLAQARRETEAFVRNAPFGSTPPQDMQAKFYSDRVAANTPGAFRRQAPRAALIGTGVLAADKLAGLNLVIPPDEEEETAQGALGPDGEQLYAQDPGMYGFDFNRFVGRNPFYTAQEGGEIVGPGTATSDSIPALLSDGEFVVTAKAVRNAGAGDRRAGAQRMYDMMKRLEQGGTA
jgi:hypothetical protein